MDWFTLVEPLRIADLRVPWTQNCFKFYGTNLATSFHKDFITNLSALIAYMEVRGPSSFANVLVQRVVHK